MGGCVKKMINRVEAGSLIRAAEKGSDPTVDQHSLQWTLSCNGAVTVHGVYPQKGHRHVGRSLIQLFLILDNSG